MKQIKWGIISTGAIAHSFAQCVANMGGETVIAAVGSRDEVSAREFADEFGIAKAYGSYEALASDPDVDIIYIGTPHSMHYENMLLCLEHGKNVMCEKSFTVTAKQAEEIFSLSKQKNLFVMEAFWTKFIPIYREVEKIISDGAIGKINFVAAQYGYCTSDMRAIRKFDPNLAGGALLDIGVYNIGFACMMLGYNPKEVFSTAVMGGAGTDELSGIILRYENGAIAQLTTAIQTEIPVLGCVYGTKGRIIIPEFKNPKRIEVILQNGPGFTKEQTYQSTGFEYEIREAEHCVARGKTQSDIMTAEQSIAVMRIMDRVRSIWGMKFSFEV